MATRDVFSEDELAQLRGFPEPARAELIRYFTLGSADEAFVRKFRGQDNVLGVAVQLCTLPWLGFVPDDVAAVPAARTFYQHMMAGAFAEAHRARLDGRPPRLRRPRRRSPATFDDPNLVSRAGLVPVMALAQRAGLTELVAKQVRPGGPCGVNAHAKVPCLVAGMIGGADSIEDMDLLRHGAMDVLFGGIRAPSTLGSHLRSYTCGNVRQLEAVNRQLLAELATRAPLLPGKDVLAFLDIDSMQKRVYGHKKQGARFGHTKIQGKSLLVRGLNALAAVVSTPLSAPVIAATRLRGGNAASVRGAASFAAEAIATAREAGCTGLIVVRMDSAYYAAKVIAAIRRAGARFSVTVSMDPKVRAAIAAIPGDAWTAIRYPRAIWDDQLRAWVSDAEVAEAEYTAFASKKGQAVTARLIVRRVRDLNKQATAGQDELFPVFRYHAVFTDSPFELLISSLN